MPHHNPPALRRRHLLAAAALPWLPAVARATPVAGGKTVTLVVSYPPGGGADLMARLIAPRLAEALGQTVVVENKPGAGGVLAGAQVARGVADGSQLLFDASSFAVAPSLYPKMGYDPAKAFTPIGVVAQFPNVLVAHPPFGAATVKDVVAQAKAKPGAIAYASSGNGSAQHLAGALFEDLAGVDLLHVPYKGGGPAMTDVMGGQVPLFFANLASSLGHIQSGRLRPLAVTSRNRSAALPQVPTMAEAGVPGYEVSPWFAVFMPASTPKPIVSKLNKALLDAMKDPDVVKRFETIGAEPVGSTPDELARHLARESERWTQLITERGIKLD